MDIGFTGTRHGMTPSQMINLHKNLVIIRSTLVQSEPIEKSTFHHGDCVGADAEAHVIATILGFTTVIHPPRDDKYRAFCKGDYVLEPKYYTARNRDIVHNTELLFGAPKGSEVCEPRSGTWQAIRYGRELAEEDKQRVVILT